MARPKISRDATHLPIEQEAEKPKYPGEKPQYRPGYGNPQKKPASTAFSIIVVIIVFIFLIGFSSFLFSEPTDYSDDGSDYDTVDKDPGTVDTPAPTYAPSGNGYCSSNKQCYDFGRRNCGGYNLVLCGSDSMCHCCLSFRNERCYTCQEGGASCTAPAGGYCERGVCTFRMGGLTSQ